jgi:hypothetical protein
MGNARAKIGDLKQKGLPPFKSPEVVEDFLNLAKVKTASQGYLSGLQTVILVHGINEVAKALSTSVRHIGPGESTRIGRIRRSS